MKRNHYSVAYETDYSDNDDQAKAEGPNPMSEDVTINNTAGGHPCCEYVKADGSGCLAVPRHGSRYCFFHDPDSAAERDAARRAGGVERSRKHAVLPSDTPDMQLATTADVINLLGRTLNQALRGEVDPKVSNAVGYLSGILLRATEQDDLERRLTRLEQAIPTGNGRTNRRSGGGDDPFAFNK